MRPGQSATILTSLCCCLWRLATVHAGGIQSGPSGGAFFAGGMFLDKGNDNLYMTGIHYNDAVVSSAGVAKTFAGNPPIQSQSSCFLASLRMEQDSSKNQYVFNSVGDWTSKVDLNANEETCTTMALHKPSQIVLLGTKEMNRASGPPLMGNLVVYDRDDIASKQLTEMSLVSQDDKVQKIIYPVALAEDSVSNDFMYIAVLASTDAQDNSASLISSRFPNWLKHQKYGSSFEMHVSKIKLSQGSSGGGFDGIPTGSISASKEWTTEFPLDQAKPETRVFVSGILHKQDVVVVVGSTRGTGPGYGLAAGDDEDGFVATIDAATGEILGSGAREGSTNDDIVTGICDDPNDPQHFFIVGGTLGLMGDQQADLDVVQTSSEMLQPFVRQIKVDRSSSDDDNLWTMQWAVAHKHSATKPSYGSAIGCVVDGDSLYVAGTIDGGAGIIQGDSLQVNQGGDDVWITKINKSTRKVQWMTQLGTSGDDRLARYGGITVDKAGHPLIYGDTTGSLYRQRDATEDTQVVDMFAMSIDKDTGGILHDQDNFWGGISTQSIGGTTQNSVPTAEPTYFTDFPTKSDGTIPDDDAISIDDDDDVDDDDDDDDDDAVQSAPSPEPTYLTYFPTKLDEEDIPALIATDDHIYKPIGLQITGPAYAGGILFDSQTNSALLTGASYNDDDGHSSPTGLCFTGAVDLHTGDLTIRTPKGSKDLQQACSAIAFDTNRNAAYAIGVAESDSTGDLGVGGPNWTQADNERKTGGVILQMNENVQILGGDNILSYPGLYPVAVVTHPRDKDQVFVASIASKINGANPQYSQSGNFMDTENLKYGSDFFLTVDSYSVKDVPDQPENPPPKTLEHSWIQQFVTDDFDINLGGMVMAGNGNVLVVVGSTRGSGGPFEVNDGEDSDMDGFILKINPEDGNLVDTTDGNKASTRLDSVNRKDDWILNVCNDRFDHDAFYVVGRSMGKIHDLTDEEQPPEGSTHGFVAKVNLQTLSAVWLKHFTMISPAGGPLHGEALSCTVTPDSRGDNIVYVGGTVRDGATLVGSKGDQAPFGKDDIFVASMNGETGALNWIQQIGTPQDDRLSKAQGLDVDAYGNLLVYGETTGDFYGKHSGDSPDLVVFTVNKRDGSYLSPRTGGKGVGVDQSSKATDPKNSALIPVHKQPSGIGAIQTSQDKIPSYAGGMYYDSYTNAVYLTGATYSSNNKSVSRSSHCIFAVATLPKFQWVQQESFGTNRGLEACNALSLANYNGKSEAIVVGAAEPSGLMNSLRSQHSKQYGMIMDLVNQGGNYQMIGGAIVEDEIVQYPVKVVTDNEQVYVVSMGSISDGVESDSERADGKKYPNFTMGGVSKYGAKFEILVERHTLNHADNLPSGSMVSSMDLDWRKPLETADQKSIFVSGMAMIDSGDTLVVVGSTLASEDGADFDGIMAKLSTDTGAFASDGDESRSVAYFASKSEDDDWILSVCPDPDDDRYFYITGATAGTMTEVLARLATDVTVHAVVSKIETSSLNIVWTTQFPVTHASGTTDKEAASVALGCAVVPGKGHIYVAGDVENGAILKDAKESAGGDDIFVAMLDTKSGDKIWTKQVGSNGDDRIARGGGIAVDGNGNAVIYGDTTGDFHRKRSRRSAHNSDLFLMVFNHDNGAHTESLSDQSVALGWKKTVDSKSAPTEWFGGVTSKMKPNFIEIIIGVSVAAGLFLLCSCLLRRRRRAKATLIKKNSIFTYLQKFSVEDLDLRKSPAGGWHGTYLGKLAHGINTNSTLPESPYRDEELEDEDSVFFESAKKVYASNRSRRSKKGSLFSDSMVPSFSGSYRDNDDDGLRTREKSSRENKFSIV